jgi:putative membrane protein
MEGDAMSYAMRAFALVTLAAGAVGVVAGPAGAAPSAQDTRFLREAHQTNLAEIAVGQLAEQKGASQTVRDIGARLVTDHTALDGPLRSAASALRVSLPTEPTAEQQAVATRLRNASGAEFDRLFVITQLDGHARAIRAGETEIASGSDPRARQVAIEAAPVIKAHHDALMAAARQLGIPTSVDAGNGGQAAPGRPYLAAGTLLAACVLLLGAGGWLRRVRRNQ